MGDMDDDGLMDRFMAAVPASELTFGLDDEHPGRYFARAKWDDAERRIHNTLSAVNEPTAESAVDGVIEEYRHLLDRPDLHWPYS